MYGGNMKKYYILCFILLIIIIYKAQNSYFDYKLDVSTPCITGEKLDEKSKEYYKFIYDENGNRKKDDYEQLEKKIFNEIDQNGKYKIYLLSGNEKFEVKEPEDFRKFYFFIGVLVDKYPKNSEVGKQDFLLIEDIKTKENVFTMKRYQIYPYRKMFNSSYTGAASVIVQFECALKRSGK